MNLQPEGHAVVEPHFNAFAKQHERVEESFTAQLDPAALSLDERGMIIDCNKTFEKLFGLRRSDLVWRHVSTLFTQLIGVELVQAGRINPHLNYLCRCGQLYQGKNRQGDTFLSNLSLVRLKSNGRHFLRMIVRPSGNAMS
jgi:PAS domain S-box-containing protein